MKTATTVAVVVPSIRKHSIEQFVREWRIQDSKLYTLYVVEDGDQATFALPPHVVHLSRADIPAELEGVIGTTSSAIRSLGFHAAYLAGHEYMLTLDDDCLPSQAFPNLEALVYAHLQVLTAPRRRSDFEGGIFNSMAGGFPRGFPDTLRGGYITPAISVGSWDGVPDLDGHTQLKLQQEAAPFPPPDRTRAPLPFGVAYTMSGMHLMFARPVAPLMYFFPHFDTFYRYDDIWLGFVLKRVLDGIGIAMVHSGNIYVTHARASDAVKNADLEDRNGGLDMNDRLFRAVMASYGRTLNFAQILRVVGERVPHPYFEKVFSSWSRYFDAFPRGELDPLRG